MKIRIINGPNLNLLGKRQVEIYGEKSADDLKLMLEVKASELKVEVELLQSNYEGQIIEWIQSEDYDALIINPAGYSHTSVAILDALLYTQKPKIEVHLSNIDEREPIRRQKITAEGVDRLIMGKHFSGYIEAMEEIYNLLD